jgi:predicted negative regulator of RcsB-dependent stress response
VVTKEESMVSVIVVVAIIAAAGWFVWRRRSRWQTPSELSTAENARPETLAFEAFTHGNSYLAEGKFDDAVAAFQRARELDPKRPHVADRLAEVERRQRAAHAAPAVNTPS